MLSSKTFYTFAHIKKLYLGFEALFFIFFKLKRAVVPSNCSCYVSSSLHPIRLQKLHKRSDLSP